MVCVKDSEGDGRPSVDIEPLSVLNSAGSSLDGEEVKEPSSALDRLLSCGLFTCTTDGAILALEVEVDLIDSLL